MQALVECDKPEIMKKITLFIAALAALASCQKPETPSSADQQDPSNDLMPINLSLDLQTKVSDTYFDEGDQVGIYVVRHEEWNWGDPYLGDSGNTYDNVCHTYNWGSWSFGEMYWQDKHTPCDFYCYYPYTDYVSSAQSHFFTVNPDQSSLENYKRSDFVWGKAYMVSPTADQINIDTRHVMSNAVIYLRPGDGFTAEAFQAADIHVRIRNVMCDSYVNLSNGNVTATNYTQEITPYNEGDRYRAVVVPQTVPDGSELIVVTVNGTEYAFKKGFTFDSGRQHKFTVTVNKTGSGVNVGVGGWDEDGNDNGGDAE